jgi:nickel-dependent lactate racemase
LRIGVGTILPHPVAGWGGGAKIIYPGVGGEDTVAHYHMQQVLLTRNIFGQTGSPIRAKMEQWVEQLGLHFIVNVICTAHGEIYKAVAGHFIAAHRQGVTYAQDVFAVRVAAPADVVVASSYPADLDLWQAGKGMMSADLLARDGGIIILVTPCPEGIGPHKELAELVGNDDPDDLARRVLAGEFADPVVVAVAVTMARMRRRCRYAIVSEGIDQAMCDQMKMRRFATVQAAVDWALGETGPQARLSVIPYGAETVPLLPEN